MCPMPVKSDVTATRSTARLAHGMAKCMDGVTRGDRMRIARKRAGLGNMAEAGARLGVSESQYSRYEANKSEMPFSTGMAFCRLTGCPPEWLEYGEGLAPQAKTAVLRAFLGTRDIEPELKQWLAEVPPSPVVAYDEEFVRGLVSTWYRGPRLTPKEASDATAVAIKASRRARKKTGA
jgi:transcriptional regulator with XRE-family HTH domain